MKKSFLSIGLLTNALIFGISTATLGYARDGHGTAGGGGGDIQCDAKIQQLLFQDEQHNSLRDWIRNKGPEAQNFKLDLSSSLNPSTGLPYTAAEYEAEMIDLLDLLEKSPDISCVKEGDPRYPVDINDRSKICATFKDDSGIHMTCDRELMKGLSPDDWIQQSAHEIHILVPGLELDRGSLSNYQISRQLSKSTDLISELRLVVKSSPTPSSNNTITLNRDVYVTMGQSEAWPITSCSIQLKTSVTQNSIFKTGREIQIGKISLRDKKFLMKTCEKNSGGLRDCNIFTGAHYDEMQVILAEVVNDPIIKSIQCQNLSPDSGVQPNVHYLLEFSGQLGTSKLFSSQLDSSSPQSL